MRIIVDAMGSDNHPVPDVLGTILAAREIQEQITLIGDEVRIQQELTKHAPSDTPPNIDIVHTDQFIRMDDKPTNVLKEKTGSSMHVGMKMLETGQADAFVTMGNTGAAHAIATLYAPRRIRGIKRPALSAIFRIGDHPIVFLDVGANADSKVEWLVQFAIMGTIYAENALGLKNPRIGLLSNGEEEGKGTTIIRETGIELKQSTLNFVGNVEPKEIFNGDADVVVSDGFTGNMLAKTYETSTRYLAAMIREEVKRNVISMLGGFLIRPALNNVRKKLDTSEVGGAPLLGVDGVVIIGHGSSTEIGVKNAIHQAKRAVDGRIIDSIRQNIRDS